MVIVSGTYGQFCNQLFRLGHHVANGLQYGYTVNCADFEHLHLFANLTQHNLVSDVPVLSGWQQKLLRIGTHRPFQKPIRQLFKQQGYTLLDQPYLFKRDQEGLFLEQARQQKLIATNWDFRDFDAFNQQYAAIRDLFTLPVAVEEEATTLVNEARQLGDIVVGVHLRRGDYAQWEGGRYYYNDATYVNLMTHLTGLWPDQQVVFLLCSNEAINPLPYATFSTIISTKPFTVDLAAFSKCDYLIGPPSTFSLWASYIGQLPHYHLREPKVRPKLTDFFVARG